MIFGCVFKQSQNQFPDNEKNNSDAYSLFTEYQGCYRLNGISDLTAGVAETFNKVNSQFYGDHSVINFAGYSQLEIRPANR